MGGSWASDEEAKVERINAEAEATKLRVRMCFCSFRGGAP
jgi:hypothetical protein